MKPEVQAAIESRRQWFWVWTLGICSGFGFTFLLFRLTTDPLHLVIPTLVIAGLGLFIQTLRLRRALLAWSAFLAATVTLLLSALVLFVNAILS
jgi:hypothetical protein